MRRTKAQPAQEEESIYNIGNIGAVAGYSGPKTKTLNVGTPAAQPKVRMHADSSQIESLLNPVRGPRDAQARAGIKPTDHARQNRAAIREASQLNALRKLQDDAPAPSPAAATGRQNSAASRGPAAAARPPRRSSSSDGGGGRDFVAENRLQAGAAAAARAGVRAEGAAGGEGEGKYLAKKDYGRVPHYLVERKAEMAACYEAELAAKEAALIPPGMRLLPEEERRETLAMLEKNKAEVDKAIRSLPFVIETPSQIRRQNELNARLKEIEEAVKIFSRAKVLVHI